jgi:hypothetical protein
MVDNSPSHKVGDFPEHPYLSRLPAGKYITCNLAGGNAGITLRPAIVSALALTFIIALPE